MMKVFILSICLTLLTTQVVVQAAHIDSGDDTSQDQPSTSLPKNDTSDEDSVIVIESWTIYSTNATNNSNETDSQEKTEDDDKSLDSSSRSKFRNRRALTESSPESASAGPSRSDIKVNSTTVKAPTVPVRRYNSTHVYKARTSLVKKPATNSTSTNNNSTVKSSLRKRREVDIVLLDDPKPPAVLIIEFNTTPRSEEDGSSNDTSAGNSKDTETDTDANPDTDMENTGKEDDDDSKPQIQPFINSHGPAPFTWRPFHLAPNSSEEAKGLESDADIPNKRKRRNVSFYEFFGHRNGTHMKKPISDEDKTSIEGSQEGLNTTNNTVVRFTTIFIQVYRVPTANKSSEDVSDSKESKNDDGDADDVSKTKAANNSTEDETDDTVTRRRKRQAAGYPSADDSTGTGKSDLPPLPPLPSDSPATNAQPPAALSTNNATAGSAATSGDLVAPSYNDATAERSDMASSSAPAPAPEAGNLGPAPTTAAVPGSSSSSAPASTIAGSTAAPESSSAPGSTTTPSTTSASPSSSSAAPSSAGTTTSPSSSGASASATSTGNVTPAPITTLGNTPSAPVLVTGTTSAATNASSSTTAASSGAPGASTSSPSASAPQSITTGDATTTTSNSTSTTGGVTTVTQNATTVSADGISSVTTGTSVSGNPSGATATASGSSTPTAGSSAPVAAAPVPGPEAGSLTSSNRTGRTDVTTNTNNVAASPPGKDDNASSGDGDGKYQFAYQVSEASVNEFFSQHESGEAGMTKGEYRVLLPDGRTEVVSYTADDSGYHPQVSYEGSANGTNPAPAPASALSSPAVDALNKNNQGSGGNERSELGSSNSAGAAAPTLIPAAAGAAATTQTSTGQASNLAGADQALTPASNSGGAGASTPAPVSDATVAPAAAAAPGY